MARTWSVVLPVVAVALVAALVAAHGEDVLAAAASLAPAAFALAVAVHAVTLAARAEAWRTVLGAIGDGVRVPVAAVHRASAGSFVAGCVVAHLAMPTRIALLHRFCPPGRAPRAVGVLVADAPIIALEGVCIAAVVAVAAGAVPGVPWWGGFAGLAGVGALLVALRRAQSRWGHRPWLGGLAVLADKPARGRLAAVVAGFTALTWVRVWVVLAAFGLPHGPQDVAVLLTAWTLAGLLPLGPAAGPVAALAGLPALDAGAAAAVGLALTASSTAGVVVYGAGVLVATPVQAARRYATRLADGVSLTRTGSGASW